MTGRQFDDTDVEAVVRLLGEVAGMTAPLGERRSRLIEGLAKLVQADVWIWAGTRGFENNAPQPLYLHDGGYVGEAQRAALFHHSAQAGFWEAVNLQLDRPDCGHRTIVYDFEQTPVANLQCVRDAMDDTGLSHLIFSIYPADEGVTSVIGLHRRHDRPPYTQRERALAHLVIGQVDWLHRDGLDVPANSSQIEGLTPRLREVLIHLIAGFNRKQIARHMGISEHTVNDYCKLLHQRFDVSSRSELLAMFIGKA